MIALEKLQKRRDALSELVKKSEKPYRQRNLKKQYRRVSRRLGKINKKNQEAAKASEASS